MPLCEDPGSNRYRPASVNHPSLKITDFKSNPFSFISIVKQLLDSLSEEKESDADCGCLLNHTTKFVL